MFHLHDQWEQGYVESKTLVLLFTARFRNLQGLVLSSFQSYQIWVWQNSQQYVLTSLQNYVRKELYSHHIQSFLKAGLTVQCHHCFHYFCVCTFVSDSEYIVLLIVFYESTDSFSLWITWVFPHSSCCLWSVAHCWNLKKIKIIGWRTD